MKKIIIFCLVCLTLACTPASHKEIHKTNGDTYYTDLITLTVNGKSHEFVNYHMNKYNNGIAHWPDCKYCKKNENN